MEIEFAVFVGLTTGLVEVIKRTIGFERYLPLCALIIGVGLNILYYGVSVENSILGLIIGLSSMGLYSGTKTTIKG
jgi:hypothetical protein